MMARIAPRFRRDRVEPMQQIVRLNRWPPERTANIARSRVDAAARAVTDVLADDRVVYGVNTGFGSLARTRIEASRLAELQRALVLSHAAGTGSLIDDATVRLIVAQKIAALARGHSG